MIEIPVLNSNGSDVGNKFVQSFYSTWNKIQIEKEEWILNLQGMGVKAAHPNDGWVANNYLTFQYPYFFEYPIPGETIAIGKPEDYRIVRILKIEPQIVTKTRYYFEEIS